jgi:hypothetical protein
LEEVMLVEVMTIWNERYSPALVLRLWKGGIFGGIVLGGLSQTTKWNVFSP